MPELSESIAFQPQSPRRHSSNKHQPVTNAFSKRHRDASPTYEASESALKLHDFSSRDPSNHIEDPNERYLERSRSVEGRKSVFSQAIDTRNRRHESVASALVGSNTTSNNDSNVSIVGGNWTEYGSKIEVLPRHLTVLDVAALIFNKMVGTGIFTIPGLVMNLTKSRNISIVLWTVGGLWTMLFLVVYLEFGIAIPFNGGDLVYLDNIYTWKPIELLATILFSGFFLALGNSYGNCISFAKHVLPSTNTDPDARLVKLIAIVVISFVCLIHYFSSRTGLFLNKALFWYKTVLILVLFGMGMKYVRSHESTWNDKKDERGPPRDCLAAMVAVFYTYQGWENANYIVGEIRPGGKDVRTPARTLKFGAFLAVGAVWVLYIMITLAYYMVLDSTILTEDKNLDLGTALHFAPKVGANELGIRICIALSAFGNVLAVTFTSAKVKQAIAKQRILPFWKFLGSNSRTAQTPQGALVLHWISTTIIIAASPVSPDGYVFVTGLFTYGHLIFSSFVTLGIFWLPKRMKGSSFNFSLLKLSPIRIAVAVVFIFGNILVLILAADSRQKDKIPRFWWPVIIGIILAVSALYWGFIILMTVQMKGKEEPTVGSMLGFKITIHREDGLPPKLGELQMAVIESRKDGTNRRLEYEFSGVPARIGGYVKNTTDWIAKYLF